MPLLNRRRATRILIVAAACVPLLLAGGAAVISVLIGQRCSGGAGVADSASQLAQRAIPANFLSIYESVGARYRIPWEVLAGIGEDECDHGRNPDPSCTPQPGARGPGVANGAGASGPMQAGVGGGPCGSAGDEYDQLRRFLPNPSLGPHDPTTAVELAALVLIKAKGAPTGQAIDTYLPYVPGIQRLRADGGCLRRPGDRRRARLPGHQYGRVRWMRCGGGRYVHESVRRRGLGAVAKRPGSRLRPAQGGADPRDRTRHDHRWLDAAVGWLPVDR